MIRAALVFSFAAVFTLLGCGGDGEVEQGAISAEITCANQDSLLATVYMADGEAAGASQWCACGSEACSVEFSPLGLGDYVLGVSNPDSLYMRTQGAEGFAQTLGYYADGGLDQVADTITLSEEQPSANIMVDVGSGAFGGTDDLDTLGTGAAADTVGMDGGADTLDTEGAADTLIGI